MKYRRVIVTKPGGPSVLQVIEEDLRDPSPTEIRVKVLTTGISFIDILLREGNAPNLPKYPFTPGCDIVGIVDKVGHQITELTPGQRIVAVTMIGAHADYVYLHRDELVISPTDLDPILSEPVVLNYLAAYQMLHRFAKVSRGETILIHGAGGGIGTALLELGKLINLNMYGTASANKHHLIKELGGKPIDYHKQQFTQSILDLTKTGVDAAFDAIGGMHWLNSYRCLRPCGRLVMFGISGMTQRGKRSRLRTFFSRANWVQFKALPLLLSSRSVIGYNLAIYKSIKPNFYQEDLKTVLALLKTKKINPVIAAKFELSEIVEAHELFEKNQSGGRIVLICKSH